MKSRSPSQSKRSGWLLLFLALSALCLPEQAFSLDDDGNGVSDVWEHFVLRGNLSPADLPRDPDGDGHETSVEALFGTDPRDSRSITRVLPPIVTDMEASFSFKSIRGIAYQPQTATDLNQGFIDFGPLLHGTGETMEAAISIQESPAPYFRLRADSARMNEDDDLLDAFEEALFGSSDNAVNSDTDALSDVEEFRLTRLGIPLDPAKEFTVQGVRDGEGDADGDGVSDLAELRGGTNPADATSFHSSDPFVINVKRYGAKGDGVTDDHAAIAKAIARMNAAGGQLYFPPGHYVDGGEHVIDKGQVVGIDSQNTIWRYTGSGRFITISGFHFWNTFCMRHITVKGPLQSPFTGGAAADRTSEGIHIKDTRPNMVFEDVTIEGWGHAGLIAHDCTFIAFESCLWRGNRRGLVGGYKADLWTVRGCFFFGNDIGADIGYWSPENVPPGIREAFGPTGQHWINVGITQNRIGVLIGGNPISGVTFDQAYGEYNWQTMFMVGHDPAENWFPNDPARNSIQTSDTAGALVGSRIIWRNCYSLGNLEFATIYRHGQYKFDKCTGWANSGSLVAFKSPLADRSRLDVSDSSGTIRFSNAHVVSLGDRADYPLQPIVIVGASVNTPLGGEYTKVTLNKEMMDSHETFANSEFTAPQNGVIRVRGLLNAKMPNAFTPDGVFLSLWALVNGVDNQDSLLQRAPTQGNSATAEGSVLLLVNRGDKVALFAGVSGGSGGTSFFGITRMEIEYVRSY